MSTHPNRSKAPCRPRDHLELAGKIYSRAWQIIDRIRAERRGDWPPYVFAPMAYWFEVVDTDPKGSKLSLPAAVIDVARLAAIGSWRVTQGIYRFDPDLFREVWSTPVVGNLPHEVLHYMPEWSVYIELPKVSWMGTVVYGYWAHLEVDARTGCEELRLLLDVESNLVPMVLHLGPWPLEESIRRTIDEAKRNVSLAGADINSASVEDSYRKIVEPIVSLLLYFCAKNAEIGTGSERPSNPQPKRTKQGWRLFPPNKPKTWDVGVRIGEVLRRAREQRVTGEQRPHGSVRPHIRNAHWHTYRIGPGRTETMLRWLSPILVNVDDIADLPATIRKVSHEE